MTVRCGPSRISSSPRCPGVDGRMPRSDTTRSSMSTGPSVFDPRIAVLEPIMKSERLATGPTLRDRRPASDGSGERRCFSQRTDRYTLPIG